MGAKYIYRMDDITPGMDWQKFNKFIELFAKYNIKPLLGIVPDNRDPFLIVEKERFDFWETMRELKRKDMVEFSQHGYQHVYCKKVSGLLGTKHGYKNQSEFAGLTYDEQYTKLKEGRSILKRECLETDIFMAPSHSFDVSTLKALKDLGFKFITDGVGLYVYTYMGLKFVPQQVWEPKKFFAGIITICLHTNMADDVLFEKVRRHVAGKAEFIRFRDVVIHDESVWGRVVNSAYSIFNIVSNKEIIVDTKKSIKRVLNEIFNLSY